MTSADILMRRSALRRVPLLAVALTCATLADAQDIKRDPAPRDLPRRGYERSTTRVGPAEMRIDVDTSFLYDTNVYASAHDRVHDFALKARPQVQLDWRSGKTEAHGEVYADTRRYFDQTRENATGFGAALSGRFLPAQRQSLFLETRFDRAIESRNDPEARASAALRPRKINVLGSELGYALSGQTIGLNLTTGVQQFNYLSDLDQDRDFTMMRGSARVTLRPNAPISLFAEGYVNRRNFRTATDISGIDRDATTYGLVAGLSREVSARLRGRVGVGVFRFDPQDPSLKSYSGFAMSGDVTWNPRPRTLVTAQLFRGDVATARAGATSRTDTRVSLIVEQEAYHNLLLRGRGGWTRAAYRGPLGETLRTWNLGGEAEYLIDRRLSVFAGADYTRRKATDPLRAFARAAVTVGLRVRM